MQVEHVQCFLLMSSFLCSVNCLPQAWIMVGQAVRIAQDIGLHVSHLLRLWGFYLLTSDWNSDHRAGF